MRSGDLFAFIRSGNLDAVRTIFSYEGRLLDCINADGHTPLTFAIQVLQNDCVALLLQSGADPRFTDAWGNAPIVIAAAQQNYLAVRLLLDAGVKKDEVDERGASLETTAHIFHDPQLRLLVETV